MNNLSAFAALMLFISHLSARLARNGFVPSAFRDGIKKAHSLVLIVDKFSNHPASYIIS